MKATMKKKVRWIGIAVLAVTLLLAAAFFIYTAGYYKAEESALAVMNQGSTIEVRDNLTILSPTTRRIPLLFSIPAPRWTTQKMLW